jgi:hypothetical protein
MTLSEFKARYRVNKFYSYSEERVVVTGSVSNIYFGWELADAIDLSKRIVLSTPSRSKKLSKEYIAWSKSEGVTAATLEDYRKYFVASFRRTPEEFLEEYGTKLDEFEQMRSDKNPSYKEGEGAFILDLAEMIICDVKEKFSGLGRVYKVVTTENYENLQA